MLTTIPARRNTPVKPQCPVRRLLPALLCLLGVAVSQAAIGADRFVLTDLDLRDPHVFVNFLGCRDVTDTLLLGFAVNTEIQTSIQTDADMDGFLDQSYVVEFLPLDQGAATNPMAFGPAVCTAPLIGTQCGAIFSPSSATATLGAVGNCLTPLAGTTHPYTPAITNASPACFSTSTITIQLDLGGIPITLHDARIAASFTNNPASALNNGLLMGFISETDANNTVIPATFPLVGGQTLASLLPGGTGNCASASDKDTNNGVMGWWFYFNFPADRTVVDAVFADGFETP